MKIIVNAFEFATGETGIQKSTISAVERLAMDGSSRPRLQGRLHGSISRT